MQPTLTEQQRTSTLICLPQDLALTLPAHAAAAPLQRHALSPCSPAPAAGAPPAAPSAALPRRQPPPDQRPQPDPARRRGLPARPRLAQAAAPAAAPARSRLAPECYQGSSPVQAQRQASWRQWAPQPVSKPAAPALPPQQQARRPRAAGLLLERPPLVQTGPLRPAPPGAPHRPPRLGRAAAPGLARRALQRAPAPLLQRRHPLAAGQAPDWALAPEQAPSPRCLARAAARAGALTWGSAQLQESPRPRSWRPLRGGPPQGCSTLTPPLALPLAYRRALPEAMADSVTLESMGADCNFGINVRHTDAKELIGSATGTCSSYAVLSG